ncbi:MAG: hypothetical protein J2P46_09440 [Zavarzinella sp.]|nr:hypothetical protein [Zavarzinella sp.]
MGVLTDFVVVDHKHARRVLKSACPSRDFGGLDAKGIDTVKLGTLHAVLVGGEYDPSFMTDCLHSGGVEGPWVFEVPDDLVQRLAQLSPRQLVAAGKKWAVTEEFSPKFENWPAEAVQQVLGDLADLCRRAAAEGKPVLMWMSL